MLICKLQRFTSDKEGHFIKIKLAINHEALA